MERIHLCFDNIEAVTFIPSLVVLVQAKVASKNLISFIKIAQSP